MEKPSKAKWNFTVEMETVFWLSDTYFKFQYFWEKK